MIFVVGLLVHKLLISRVTGIRGSALESEGHYAQLILTLGLALILQNGGLYVFGSAPVSITTPLSSSAWEIGPAARRSRERVREPGADGGGGDRGARRCSVSCC